MKNNLKNTKRKVKNLTYLESLVETYQGSYLSKDGKTLLSEPMPRYQAKQAAIDEIRKHGKCLSIDSMCAVSDEDAFNGNQEAKFNESINYEDSSLVNEDPSAEDLVSFKDTFSKLLASMDGEEEIKQLCIATRQSGTEHFLSEEHQKLIEEKLGEFEGGNDKECAKFLGHYVNEDKNFSVSYHRFKRGFKEKAKKLVG